MTRRDWFIWKRRRINSYHELIKVKQEKCFRWPRETEASRSPIKEGTTRESCYINKYLFHGRLHKTYGKWNIYSAAFQDASFSRVDDDNKNANKLGNLIWVMVHFREPAPAYYRKQSRITLQMCRASGMFIDDAIDTFKKHFGTMRRRKFWVLLPLWIFEPDTRFCLFSSRLSCRQG